MVETADEADGLQHVFSIFSFVKSCSEECLHESTFLDTYSSVRRKEV